MSAVAENQFELAEETEQLERRSQLRSIAATLAVCATIFGATNEQTTQAETMPIQADTAAASKHCETIRRRWGEMVIGTACTTDAKSMVIGGGFRSKGWVFSLVKVAGIYKCGFVQEGLLPKMTDPNSVAIQRCENYYKPETQQQNFEFVEINCPEVLPGLQGCNDGTYNSHIQPGTDGTLWGNYATIKASPFNVLGTHLTHRLSMQLGKTPEEVVHYRAKVKGGNAVLVRGHNQWGFVVNDAVASGDRQGGPVTDFTPAQRQQIQQNPHALHILQQLVGTT